jgi:hypothetical protein
VRGNSIDFGLFLAIFGLQKGHFYIFSSKSGTGAYRLHSIPDTDGEASLPLNFRALRNFVVTPPLDIRFGCVMVPV